MRSHARITFLALLAGVLLVLAAPVAAQAAGIENFYASNCKVNTCERKVGEKEPEEIIAAGKDGFTQAGGHPNFGVTDFKIKTEGAFPNAAPEGIGTGGSLLTHIRTDVAPGVATSPESPAKCSFEEFGKEFEPAPGVHTHLYRAPTCGPGTEIGFNDVVVYIGPEASPKGGDLPIPGNKVYNLVQPKALATDFGVAIKLPEALTDKLLGFPAGQLYAHTLIEGNVEWGAEALGTGKADYHDYFEINVSPELPLISSRLIFNGQAGGAFLTNPTACTGIGPQTTTRLSLSFLKGEKAVEPYEAKLGNSGCNEVPFAPTIKLAQGSTAPDAPDALVAELILPHHLGAGETDSSQVRTATVALPANITLNSAAGGGLEACTPAQIGIGTKNPIACPGGSSLGSVTLNVPGLPEGSLKGNMYLGGPEGGGPITAPPYVVYVAAESERYGVIVRVKGLTKADPNTGQLTASFTENPEQPFSDLILKFNGGSRGPLANGLTCGVSQATTSFVPFTGEAAAGPLANFEVAGCANPVPFAPTQATSSEPAQAASSSTYALSFNRPEGNQYLAKLTNVLPPGLVGLIPTVTTCGEPQAALGTCTSASRIGSVAVSAGAGSAPYTFHGQVYLTGPFEGAPYGLSIVVPNVAGPFSLGNTVARATINVNQSTGQVIATDNSVPMIVAGAGIPIRVRTLTFAIDRQGFELNPTNCTTPLFTESTFTGSLGTVATAKTPFPVEGCSGLSFAPAFKATTSSKTSKNNGASLETTINQPPGGANIKSVLVTLPKTLPSRLSTLQKACLEATFAANPYSCPEGSLVGSARANTPTLPGKLQGPAYLVSHGGAAFPDLDLVLEANGVRVIVVGNTDIKKGVTTTNFASSPDVPVSSITVLLPTGPHSALTAYGDVCKSPLYMPTTITAQNGKLFKQNTKINVTNCGVKVVGQKVIGNTAYLTVRTFAPGRISGSGSNVITTGRNLSSAQSGTSLKVSLNGYGASHKPRKVKIRVGFNPKSKSFGTSVAYATVYYR
jgi:hypothetical protein